jgi:glutathione S-transferase
MAPKTIQSLILYGKGGPNPPKVAFILEELGLLYDTKNVPMSELKQPEYTAINPNGRLPSLADPNTGITVWESGAIIEYIIETYDKEHKLSFPAGTADYFHAKQWLYFQVSGQGPYFGQLAWFKKFHGEQVPSAVARYAGEINRVTGVLEGWLAKQKADKGGHAGDGPWLVGNKLSYADIAFLQWYHVVVDFKFVTEQEHDPGQYPEVHQWLDKMKARKAIAKVLEETDFKH